MNVLMVGGGKAGSWAMRGVQLGAALGARVTSEPHRADFEWADVIVLVKRAILQFGRAVQASGKPFVWDALDFWRQPDENGMSEKQALSVFDRHLHGLRPACVIGATNAMASFLGGIYLPHHCWSGLTPSPAREKVQVVAYEGNPLYLGRWQGWLQEACEARGWAFVINPPDLRQADILVSFRDGPWDGWVCRQWKSGVKLVNAIAAGRPVLTQRSAAQRELLQMGHVGQRNIGFLVESPADLDYQLEFVERLNVRQEIYDECCQIYTAFALDAIAAEYRQVLEAIPCHA